MRLRRRRSLEEICILAAVWLPSFVISWRYSDESGSPVADSAEPRIVPGEWSECSATCGAGVQSRAAECRAAHPLAGYVVLPSHECSGQPQPAFFRSCQIQPCAQQEQAEPLEEYHWKHAQWSACSASCLGGKQRALLDCVELSSGNSVPWSRCDGRRRPPEKTRDCEQQPCPPEWSASAWSVCPSTCGAVKTRSVRCVRATAQSGGAISDVVVSDQECAQRERPPTNQSCSSTPCTHNWMIGAWSACSVSCGNGMQTRTIQCNGECSHPSPESSRACVASCPRENKTSKEEEDEESNADSSSTSNQKKLTLGIGGAATLFQGTSIKVKCPRKNFDKKKIYWTKDGKRLANNGGNVRVSSNGNLRISHARLSDGGLYECFADRLRGNVTIRFKLRPSQEGGLPLKASSDPLRPQKPLKAKYKADKWGECQQNNCALRGIQERDLHCFIGEGRSHRKVSVSICESLHINRPPSSRPCSRSECSHWNTTDWSFCLSSPCTRKWTSEQRRSVFCVSKQGATVADSECDSASRPTNKAFCANPSCVAEWRASEWGECSASCGTGGVQLRLVSCAWTGSGGAAGRACDGLPLPRASRACARTLPLPPCSPAPLSNHFRPEDNCEDLSRFCDIIKLFHSCGSAQVRQRCCSSCARLDHRLLRM